jgi:sortase A
MAPVRLEAGLLTQRVSESVRQWTNPEKPLPKAVPVVFNPLVTPDGGSIQPINTEFSLIVPKIGINAAVIPAVNPATPGEYLAALEKGIAHASTSYFPDEDGTVYLFSHSTNYDWFVDDLNAVFYLLKNLETGDLIVLFYKGERYTYRLKDKRVVAPTEVSYLVPQSGAKRLILQTCWPPGSTTERLLIFADLVEEQLASI